MAISAESALEALAQNLKCSICFDIFLDPVTSSCGKHNYCKGCLSTFHEGKAKRICPQCMESPRQDYIPQKNVILCKMVEVLGRETWEDILFRSDQKYSSAQDQCANEGPNTQTQDFCTEQDVIEDTRLHREEANGSEPRTPLSVDREWPRENSELSFIGTQTVDEMLEPGAQQAEASDSQTENFAWLKFSPHLKHSNLAISPDGRRVEARKPRGMYRSQPERFEISQIMADPEFVDGMHCWDVDVTGAQGWAVGVAYNRLGSRDGLGRTDASWCLEWSNKKLSYWHGGAQRLLNYDCPRKVRVVLDMNRGSLQFYSMCEEKTLLHSALASFTVPVRSAFWLYGLGNRSTLSFTGP